MMSSFEQIVLASRRQLAAEEGQVSPEWDTALQVFVDDFNVTFDLDSLNQNPEDKTMAIGAMAKLVQNGSPSLAVRLAAIQALKIICRSRSHLDQLYTQELIRACLQLSANKDVTTVDRVEPLKLLLNMTILGMEQFQQCSSQLPMENWSQLLQSYSEFNEEGQYIVCRLLQYAALDSTLRIAMNKNGLVYETLSATFVQVAEPLLQGPEEQWHAEDTLAARKLIWESLKGIINFALSATEPEEGLEQNLSRDAVTRLAKLVFQILAVGTGQVEPPPVYEDAVAADAAQDGDDEKSEEYTKRIREVNPAEQGSQPGQGTMWQLKQTAGNVVICLSKETLAVAADNTAGVEGLVELLHTKAALYKDNAVTDELTPVLKALFEICKSHEPARRYIKREVFGQWARPLTAEEKKRQTLGMVPAGSPSESCLDMDMKSLRATLIPLLTHWNYSFKRSVGEFLYFLCENETHDFLRLVGYGNGIGCLADKGLPGFAGLTQKAMHVDELVDMARRAKEVRGEDPDTEDDLQEDGVEAEAEQEASPRKGSADSAEDNQVPPVEGPETE